MELYPEYLEDHFSIHKLRAPPGRYMPPASSSASAMGIYERRHQPGIWGEPFMPPGYGGGSSGMDMEQPPPLAEVAKLEPSALQVEDDALHLQSPPEDSSDQEPTRPREKIQRRLAQNREAARKSRLRKKAYIQNLETSRMKLARMEQELTRARQQVVVYGGGQSSSVAGPSSFDPGVAAFEVEYAGWVEEQGRQTRELRAALQQGHDTPAQEIQLRLLVEAGLAHYDRLFRSKLAAARSDVFFVMSGLWRAAAERFFLWVGGFRPSELLKILAPQLGPLTEEQEAAVGGLQQTARQVEDALSQGMEKLQQTLSESLLLTMTPEGEVSADVGRRMASAMGRLGELAGFVDQADHLRQETLRNMYKILTTRQAARGLLALGDYSHRLRALSTLWAARPREPA